VFNVVALFEGRLIFFFFCRRHKIQINVTGSD